MNLLGPSNPVSVLEIITKKEFSILFFRDEPA